MQAGPDPADHEPSLRVPGAEVVEFVDVTNLGGGGALERYFFRLMAELRRFEVDYILVGGMAVNVHGLVRATEDIDLFVRVEEGNLERLKSALRAVCEDPCIDEITYADLAGDYPVVRYGPPEAGFVVNVMARLGEAFTYTDLEVEEVTVEGVLVRVATPRTLIRMKRGTVRPKDHADAYVLSQKFHLEGE